MINNEESGVKEGRAYLVDKYGKSGILSKFRVFICTKNSICYFPDEFLENKELKNRFKEHYELLKTKDCESKYLADSSQLYQDFMVFLKGHKSQLREKGLVFVPDILIISEQKKKELDNPPKNQKSPPAKETQVIENTRDGIYYYRITYKKKDNQRRPARRPINNNKPEENKEKTEDKPEDIDQDKEKEKELNNDKPKDDEIVLNWKCAMKSNQVKFALKILTELKESSNKNKVETAKQIHIADQKNTTHLPNEKYVDLYFIDHIELLYQSLLENYIKELREKASKAKLVDIEFKIQMITKIFTKYCAQLIKYILSSIVKLGFQKDKPIPMPPVVLPNFTKIFNETDHYLIYYFRRITITMTWNCIDGKPLDLSSQIVGAWDDLKLTFKQANTHTDFLLYSQMGDNRNNDQDKNSENIKEKVPLMCIIDYCGFRFLCEMDPKQTKDQKSPEDALTFNYGNPSSYDSQENHTYEIESKAIFENDEVYSKLMKVAHSIKNKEGSSSLNTNEEFSYKLKNVKILSAIKYTYKKFSLISREGIPIGMTSLSNNINSNASTEAFLNKTKQHYYRSELITTIRNSGQYNDLDSKNVKEIEEQDKPKVKKDFEKYFSMFQNSLNSFYYKLYDSESASELFHVNGINMQTLGEIYRSVQSPFLKEFCIIEMLARTCKKIIYHLIANKLIYKLLHEYYHILKDNKESKTLAEFAKGDTKKVLPLKYSKRMHDASDPYFSQLFEPKNGHNNLFSFDSGQKIYQNVWCEHSSLNKDDKAIEFLSDNYTSINKDNKEASKNNNQNDLDNRYHLKEAKEEVVTFFNTLFNKLDSSIKIKGEKKNYKQLWEYIVDNIKYYYGFGSKDIIIWCNLKCLSLPPFLEALQYHTGIKLNLDNNPNVVSNDYEDDDKKQKEINMNPFNEYNNKYINSIIWTTNHIKNINPNIQTYRFSSFIVNAKRINQFKGNYSHLIMFKDPNVIKASDKRILISHFYEKIFGKNGFTNWYIRYIIEIKKIKKQNIEKKYDDNYNDNNTNGHHKGKLLEEEKNDETIDLFEGLYRKLIQNEEKEREKETEKAELLLKSKIIRKPKLQFSRLWTYMLNIVKEIDEYELRDNVNYRDHSRDNESSRDLSRDKIRDKMKDKEQFNKFALVFEEEQPHNSLFPTEREALEMISQYYIKYHPYSCDLLGLCAHQMALRWMDRYEKKMDDIIEIYFKTSIEYGEKSLNPNNLFLANLAMAAGVFYASQKKYIDAVQKFNYAYLPFQANKDDFEKDYLMFIKRFIKYNIKLGDYKTALSLGDELIVFCKTSKKLVENNHTVHYERIVYNLGLVALKTNDYNRGILYCKELFKKKQDEFKKRKESVNPNDKNKMFFDENQPRLKLGWLKEFNSKLVQVSMEQEMEMMMELYLKIIIQSFNEEAKLTYLQALIRIYDVQEERKEMENMPIPTIKELFENHCLLHDLNEIFKTKILPSMKAKNKEDEIIGDKSQSTGNEQKANIAIFKQLYKYFEKSSVFYDFMEEKKDHKRKK